MDSRIFTESDTADYYDSFGDVYELVWNDQIHTGYFLKDEELSLSEAVLEMDRYIAELAKFERDKKLLNVGCGRGGTDRFLVQNFNLKIDGIDISKKQIDIAKNKALAKNLSDRCNYALASATNIPFPDNNFNYILCQESFFHIHNKRKAVSEFGRVLKNNGLIVIEDTLRFEKSIVEEINSFCGRVKTNELLTPIEYTGLFGEEGFEIMKEVDVSSHLAKTYHKIVKFIQTNRKILEEKIPGVYKDRIKTNFGFDISEKLVLERKLGCIIFVFQKM